MCRTGNTENICRAISNHYMKTIRRRLKEQGMPRLNSNSKGDLLVRTNVTIPKRLSDEQRDLMKRLAVSLGDKISDARPAKKNIFSKIKDAMD